MTATPQSYPLLARFRYAHFKGDDRLPPTENAWWESRWGGGRLLGAVIDAMNDPKHPHRLSIRIRLSPEFRPLEMQASLLRLDGEGSSSYRFEAEQIIEEGEWDGIPFSRTLPAPPGYTVAPHCFAADGLHFTRFEGNEAGGLLHSYHLDPRNVENPLGGTIATWRYHSLGEEAVTVEEQVFHVRHFQAYYEDRPDPPADFWVTSEGYALRMTVEREAAAPFRIECDRATIF